MQKHEGLRGDRVPSLPSSSGAIRHRPRRRIPHLLHKTIRLRRDEGPRRPSLLRVVMLHREEIAAAILGRYLKARLAVWDVALEAVAVFPLRTGAMGISGGTWGPLESAAPQHSVGRD